MVEVGTNSGMFGAVIHALLLSDGRDALDPFFAALLQEGRASGDATVLIWGSALRGQLALSRGDLLGAEADFATMLELLPPHEGPAARAWVLAPAAIVLALRGQADEAAALLAERAPPPPFPRTYSYALLRYGRGVVAMQQGRLKEALGELLEAGASVSSAPFAPEALPWRSAAAHCHVRLGEPAAALELARDELEAARAAGVGRAIGRALVAAALPEEGGERIALLREAVELLEGADARLELAGAQLELGAALRRDGRRVEAREVLRDSVDNASRCGASPLRERGREELATAGARPRRERLGGPEALTAAERRVVELAASGSSNREIAQALFLTQKTVESHLSSAYRKLDVSSRHKLSEVLAPAAATGSG
jgi:ATP/maltotriose-dependent transcriptional regulator MalT